MLADIVCVAKDEPAMSGVFSKPKMPKIPDPPAPPAPPAMTDAVMAADNEAARLRKKRGTASTVLAGDTAAGAGSIAKKTLLGS